MVLGKLIGVSPEKDNLIHFVEMVTGSKPLCVDVLKDHSFEITMKEEAEAKALVDTTALYEDTFLVLLEPWSTQESLHSTTFLYRIVWVQLIEMRPDCVRLAEAMAAKVGKVYARPKPEELYVRGAEPKFAVKVFTEGALPPMVEMNVDGKGEEFIYQKLFYPGLQTKCTKCGNTDHLKDDCRIKAPRWQH